MSLSAPNSAPSALSLLSEWRPDYVMIVVAAAMVYGYASTRRAAAAAGVPWGRHRDVIFALGMAALIWTTQGFLQARSFQLMWVWMTQELLLLLIVPVIVMSAQPLSLANAVHGPDNTAARVLRSGPLRILGSPLVSPVLVPVLCMVLVFGGLGAFSLSSVWGAGLVHLLLLTAGVLIALPLVSTDDKRTSLAVGLALSLGFLELILDAFPGIALLFQTHLTLIHFASDRPPFSPVAIADQHVAGGILWVVAELLDVPFLILVATAWIRADARDAVRIDAELDSRQHWATDGEAMDAPVLERPWWLDDPELRDRFRRPGADSP